MIIGSIKEDLSLEKRVSITPETAKSIINLGLKVIIESNYANHIGITDKEYKNVGAKIENSSKEVLNNCNLLTKVNCPKDEEILNLKENQTLIGVLNPHANKEKIENLSKKNINIFSLEMLPRITRAQSMDILSSQANLAGYKAVIESFASFE